MKNIYFASMVWVFLTFGLLTACSQIPQEGSKPEYTSKIDHTSRQLGDFDVNQFTDAKLRVIKMMRISQSPEEAYDIFVNRIPEWNKGFSSVTYYNGSEAIGSVANNNATRRECVAGSKKLVENIRGFEKGKFFAYTIDFKKTTLKLQSTDQLGLMTFEEDGKGGSLVTWRQYFDKKLHIKSIMASYSVSKYLEGSLQKMYGGEMIEPK
jgi:hypothetical protein